VSDRQVQEAVIAAASEVGVRLAHFRALADVGEARYLLQVEPEGKLTEGKGRALLDAVERRLTGLNIEYASKRKSQRLQAPELQVMKAGWYERGKEAQGQRLFQSKTVVLKAKEEEELSVRSQEMLVSRIGLEPGKKAKARKKAAKKA
jgi:hypothetical protein